MRLKLVPLAGAAILVGALAMPALAGNSAVNLKANMNGSRVVNPAGGDPNGEGHVNVYKINPDKGKICFKVKFNKIGTATQGYIHHGKKDEVGPEKVKLFGNSKTHPIDKCVDGVNGGYLKDLRKHPQAHYADLDTAQYPNGAIRGQFKDKS